MAKFRTLRGTPLPHTPSKWHKTIKSTWKARCPTTCPTPCSACRSQKATSRTCPKTKAHGRENESFIVAIGHLGRIVFVRRCARCPAKCGAGDRRAQGGAPASEGSRRAAAGAAGGTRKQIERDRRRPARRSGKRR